MTPRKTALVTFMASIFVLLPGLPATASQPEGLAGEMITHGPTPGPGDCTPYSFTWDDSPFFEMPLDSSDTVTVEVAIVPFASGFTVLTLEMGSETGLWVSAVGLPFTNGSISFNDGSEMPYERNRWNDVIVHLNQLRQEFDVTVNGRHGGPYPYDGCIGSCTSLGQFRILGFDVPGGSVAWVDSIDIIRHGTAGDEPFYWFHADPCTDTPNVIGGAVVFAEAPKKLHSKP